MKTLRPTFQAVGSLPQSQAHPHQNSNPYIGKSKWCIEQELLGLNHDLIQFAHWLYITESGLVLSFDRQVCVKVSEWNTL